MIGGATRWLARLCAAALTVLCALLPAHALAQTENRGFSFHSDVPCHAIVQPAEDIAAVAANRQRWSCEGLDDLPPGTRQIALRFDMEGSVIARPGVLVNSHTYREFDRFARFELVTLAGDEVATSGWLALDHFAPTSPVWKTRIVAPQTDSAAEALIVRIDAPERAGVLQRFDLVDTAPVALIANTHQLIAALLCGLLLAPAFIGLANFRALRTQYAIYHVLYCLLAVVQVATLGGLLPMVLDISRVAQFVVLHLSFDLVAAISASVRTSWAL